MRQMVRAETEQILDLSARTLSTIHARAPPRTTPRRKFRWRKRRTPRACAVSRARSPSAPSKNPSKNADPKNWEMKALLAAAATNENTARDFSPGNAAALGALEAALADMAIDLEAIVTDAAPGEEECGSVISQATARYSARSLAQTLDEGAVGRISTLYRDDARFRDAANAYLSEFDSLLARAKEGDGGGLLTLDGALRRYRKNLSRHRVCAWKAIGIFRSRAA